jgi:ParB-like nuclease domain
LTDALQSVGLVALAERIELWPIDRLRPYERNPRTHSEGQVDQIAASMVEFGWTNPVLVDEQGGILAGHGRLLAAHKLGLAEVPVIRFEHLSEAQKRAYLIADNQLALQAGWDDATLAEELAWLRDERFDLDLVGFDATELERLLTLADGEAASDEAEDDVPDPPEEPVSKPGDLWGLGNHRLLCGDATVLADVERVLGGQLADMTFCDPPYNVDYANSPKDKLRGKHRPILNDSLGIGFEAFLYETCVNILSITKGACYICMSSSELHTLQRAFATAGGKVVDLRDLGEEHLHAWPGRLSKAIRADPLRLEGGQRSLLVRRPRSGRRLVLRQARQERPAPDHEAGGPGRAGDPELEQDPGHRAGSLRRLRLDAHCMREGRTAGAAARARSEVRRHDHPALAEVQR